MPDAVLGVLDRWIDAEIDWAQVPSFAVLGIDEIALKKGHRDYVVIVTAQRPNGELQLLAVLPDRTTATVRTWLAGIPTSVRRQIRTVCTDMWVPYVTAVEEVLPHAAVAGSHRQLLPASPEQRLCRGAQQQDQGAQAPLLWHLQPAAPVPTHHP
ncbi:hypothetical protein EKD04_013535 [Chloroflexales bacterium ZM16-3]|nr:hypothetical protein [Chloroflexales bacterium ZM16-3]